jgi:general secretion pathway protein D
MSLPCPLPSSTRRAAKESGLLRTFGRNLAVTTLTALFLGCAASRIHDQGLDLIVAGKPEEGLRALETAVSKDPNNLEYRSDLIKSRSLVVQRLLASADNEHTAGRFAEAAAGYRRVLEIDPSNPRARLGLNNVDMDQRHAKVVTQAQALFDRHDLEGAQNLLRPVLQEDREQRDAKLLQRKIDDLLAEQALVGPTLRAEFKKPVNLQFRDANLKMVVEAISRTNGINILLDKDVKADLRTTIFVKDAPFDDTLDLILMQNQLEKKILSDNTVFIYPNSPAKLKDFQDLKVRSFQLVNADAKQMQTMLKTLLKIKDIFVDEKTNSVVLRDTPDTIRLAEKMIAAQDQPEPEVMLEVEVLEISRARLTELGVKLPQQFAVSATGTPAQTETSYPGGTPVVTTIPAQPLTLENLKNINGSYFNVSPLNASIDLRTETGDGNVLASPRIRVRNHDKAKIHIGDRVPVITNAVTPLSTGSQVVTGSVQYLEVGLKLDVEPDIHPDDDVAIKMALEVSHIVREVSSGTTLAYQIGSRSASTVLRLRDGETQVLAGLISDEERHTAQKFPGLGDLPILGRLFSSHRDDNKKTEIVLSITPHLTRAAQRPEAGNIEFWSGTETTLRSRPTVLRSTAPAAPAAPKPSVPDGTPKPAASAPVSNSAVAPTVVATAVAATAAVANNSTNAVAGTPAPVTPPITLYWQGASQATVGKELQVTLTADAKQSLSTLSFTLDYDPASLTLTRITEGDLFKQNGKKTVFTTKVEQETGQTFVQVARVGKDGVTGQGNVATFTFKVKAAKTQAPIVIKEPTPLSSDGRTLTYNPPAPFIASLGAVPLSAASPSAVPPSAAPPKATP